AFVAGASWRDRTPSPSARLYDLGSQLARLDVALLGLTLPAARRTHQWDLAAAGQHRARVPLVDDARRRALADLMLHRWAAGAAPLLDALPRGLIHGDANDENVLVDGNRVIGLIDFGDALENPIACELAIAATYAVLDSADPLAAAADVVAGYDA